MASIPRSNNSAVQSSILQFLKSVDASFQTKVWELSSSHFWMPKLASNTLETDRGGHQARLYRARIEDSQAQSGRTPALMEFQDGTEDADQI